MYAKVIIEYGVKKLDKEFTYLIPINLINKVKKGMKVLVPFGTQKLAGFVLEILNSCEEDYEIKEIIDIIEPELILNDELLEVGKFLKESTLCSLITAYQTMLPTGLKVSREKHNYGLYEEYINLLDISNAIEYAKKNQRNKAQVKIINDLLKKNEVAKKDYNRASVKALLEKGIITIRKENKYRLNPDYKTVEKTLSSDQQKIYDEVANNLNLYRPYLLYGVTGSGKTEVYIKLIEEVIKRGKSAIMLVPEISLTAQIAKRFYEAFGSDVALLHSSLSNGEKYDEYLKIFRGDVHVVVGTRSAIFAPFSNLGIIILDEEDSSSYKQDSNPRYHARDIALYRGKINNIPVILGSATPSLETKARADKGVYGKLVLKNRIGDAILPKIHIVDMALEMKKRNLIFSDLLIKKIQEKLNKQEQIILLLNRRGFSTFITCSNCGYTYKCPNCDITLTYHKSSNNLVCHYCGYITKKEDVCPKCRENALNYYGLGTEKLEEEITKRFSSARVIRMDQDTTQKKGAHEKIIEAFKNHEYDILLGTQMISKGLDFPLVTLVGVINADTTLNIPDYRASENTFSLLSQVAGRSGRSSISGEVVIQTFNPDHYVIKCASLNNYDRFYIEEMSFRHKLKYPPYYYLVSLKVVGTDYSKTMNDAKKVKKYLDENLNKSIIVLGPATAAIFRFNNKYRMQFVLKYQKEENLKEVLKELDDIFINNKNSYLEIDFNPLRI